jgi:hypothetical protein
MDRRELFDAARRLEGDLASYKRALSELTQKIIDVVNLHMQYGGSLDPYHITHILSFCSDILPEAQLSSFGALLFGGYEWKHERGDWFKLQAQKVGNAVPGLHGEEERMDAISQLPENQLGLYENEYYYSDSDSEQPSDSTLELDGEGDTVSDNVTFDWTAYPAPLSTNQLFVQMRTLLEMSTAALARAPLSEERSSALGELLIALASNEHSPFAHSFDYILEAEEGCPPKFERVAYYKNAQSNGDQRGPTRHDDLRAMLRHIALVAAWTALRTNRNSQAHGYASTTDSVIAIMQLGKLHDLLPSLHHVGDASDVQGQLDNLQAMTDLLLQNGINMLNLVEELTQAPVPQDPVELMTFIIKGASAVVLLLLHTRGAKGQDEIRYQFPDLHRAQITAPSFRENADYDTGILSTNLRYIEELIQPLLAKKNKADSMQVGGRASARASRALSGRVIRPSKQRVPQISSSASRP